MAQRRSYQRSMRDVRQWEVWIAWWRERNFSALRDALLALKVSPGEAFQIDQALQLEYLHSDSESSAWTARQLAFLLLQDPTFLRLHANKPMLVDDGWESWRLYFSAKIAGPTIRVTLEPKLRTASTAYLATRIHRNPRSIRPTKVSTNAAFFLDYIAAAGQLSQPDWRQLTDALGFDPELAAKLENARVQSRSWSFGK